MSIKTFAASILAKHFYKKVKAWSSNPIKIQDKVFTSLLKKAKNTEFGKDHAFSEIENYDHFKRLVPIRDYEGLKPYIEKIKKGEKDILWPGKPTYFAKTSGTTSGTKFIPISKDSIQDQFTCGRGALLLYIYHTGNTSFLNGKTMFLQGSPKLGLISGIQTGRLSGIAYHLTPFYLKKNMLPDFKTNCIEDWEKKVNAISTLTKDKDMRLLSGIPPWIIMYFENLLKQTGKKTINEVFPNLSIYMYGGVNYAPYRNQLKSLIGKEIDTIESFVASEGYFAYADKPNKEDMLLMLDAGIFYEFIPVNSLSESNPPRLSISEVALNTNYALILNTNAGLWGYNIGDTVVFTCLKPYRIKVSGRIKHYTSAFGEHVIASEVEHAMDLGSEKYKWIINDFHVAPMIKKETGKSYHQWIIETDDVPENISEIEQYLDLEMQNKNSYYQDLIKGGILSTLKITPIPKGSFEKYMKSIGKLGGQNKPPRLANDRKMAELLLGNK